MVNLDAIFGESAGKIWTTLYEEEVSPESRLKKKTKLKDHEFYGAIGWLARENKIRKDGKALTLGETNLTPEIGRNAGRVWKALNIWEELTDEDLVELTDLNKKDLFSALGWLAREDKVEFDPATEKWKLK
ncbi:MAG: winged helix-turn-helix domain-containing protein [Thermoplasmata archaeon]|nr:winged helix-turn-helix domain-containing protein [Thermoplasmata archaeon]